MLYQDRRLAIPSNSEYSVPQLREMLGEVGHLLGRPIRLEEWSNS
jgi:hypothetical protein